MGICVTLHEQLNSMRYRKIGLWGLSLWLGLAGQAQVVSERAVLDSVSTLLSNRQYQQVVDLLRGVDMPRGGEVEHLLGVAYLRLERYELALRQGELSVAQGVPMGYSLKGDAFFSIGELDSAEVAYSQAISELPENTEVRLKRAMLYMGREKWELSERDFREVLRRDSTMADAWLALARVVCVGERYTEAVSLLNAMEESTSDRTGLYALRGRCYLELGLLDPALDDAVQALSRNDRDGFALLYAIGNLDTERTLRKVEEAADRWPTDFMWPYTKGLLHMCAYRYREALECLQQAYALSSLGAVCEQMTNCYEALGLYADAVTAIDEAIRQEPEVYRYYKKRMDMLAYAGRVDEAIRQGERFLSVQPSNVETYNFLGYLCYWQHKWDTAIDYVTAGIALDQSFAPMYVLRGIIYKAKGAEAEARADFERALAHYPECGTIASMYHAYAELGRVDEGIESLDRYLTTECDEASAYYDATCFYVRIGQYDKAIAFLEQAIHKGFCQCALLEHDPDLDGLKDNARFIELFNQLKVTYHYGE